MKRARILHDGAATWGVMTDGDEAIRLASGIEVAAAEAAWLPPVTPGATIFALGLNYADHNAELGFAKPQAKPLVFLKGHGTLAGHRGMAPRPADANQMHPECELVAVIGRPARNVSRADAPSVIAGYTVACDYAVREYLENYYRPNLRVKNRDGCTPIGPWVIDAADVGDAQALTLRTTINSETAQEGSTADMMLDVAGLVEYLSGFMTLLPGDLILTGTPHGVRFVQPGDEVVCEIERVGRLVHRVIAA